MSPHPTRADASAPAQEAAGSAEGHRARLVAYVVVGLAAAGLFVRAISLPSSRWEPLGAGTFPSIVLGLLIGFCVLGVISEAMSRAREPGPGLAAWVRAHRLVIFTFVAFAIYVAILPMLGFGIATFAFLLVAQLRLAPGTWTARGIALVMALAFSFGLDWLFAEAFDIYLPRGSLFE